MPITKVPVVHKFGIISHTQRLELQERLLKQSFLTDSKKADTSSRNPTEVTEEFIQKFNSAKSLDEKEKCESSAYKMLERVRRRAGLKDGGTGSHVDLPIAWTELSQLAQCKGKIQEDCLDVLIMSLDQAPIDRTQIPALFFLAETCLYWLRTDSVNQPYLRTGEIKLLKMGQLVFTRLFHHHMGGNLRGYKAYKSRLYTYLDGLSDCQDAYNPYPNALLSLRYINEVGKIIISDVTIDPEEAKDEDSFDKDDIIEEEDTMMFPEVSAVFGEIKSSRSGAISSSVHDLSPTLWHALDVYRCCTIQSMGLKEALHALSHCGQGLANENWVDGIGATLILAEAAKTNLSALRVMQNLARGMASHSASVSGTPQPDAHGNSKHPQIEDKSKSTMVSMTLQQGVTDLYNKYDQSLEEDVERNAKNVKEKTGLSENKKESQDHHGHKTLDPAISKETSDKKSPIFNRKLSSESRVKDATEDGTMPFETPKVRSAPPGERQGSVSSVHTYTNLVFPEIPGIHGWHWEVAFVYTDVLSDICLHGSTSNIQKTALIGRNTDLSGVHKKDMTGRPLDSAGLVDLVFFHAMKETQDGGPNDWSWRIRYGAIQGLVKVCQCCAGDKNKDGLRTAAWDTLIKVHSLERDERVMEALKVGQVGASIENLLSQHMTVKPSTIGVKMATGLGKMYLPPLPPPVEAKIPNKPEPKRIIMNRPVRTRPLRTSLQDEISLATALHENVPDFNTRTTFDLKRIVEDQWRKDVQRQQVEEETGRLKDLEERDREREEKEEDKTKRKKDKFK